MTDTLNLDEIQMDDPSALLSAFNQIEDGVETTGSDPIEAKTAPAANPAEDPAKATGEPQGTDQPTNPTEPTDKLPAGQQNQDDQDPDGVATKDGKHVIPYAVLKGERERATRAEELLRQTTQELESLKRQETAGKQLGANNGGTAHAEPNAIDGLSDTDLDQLKEDFPTIYKALMVAQTQMANIENRLQPVDGAVRQMAQERAQSATESVQEAIDSIPKLAFIQANNPDAFELARQFDATLQSNPAWADKPISERFSKVTEMVEASLGEIKVPGAANPTAALTPEQQKAAAQAKAKELAAKSGKQVPTSLSEAPAGDPPAQDERQKVEDMTPAQLEAMFLNMTPEQQDAYLQNL